MKKLLAACLAACCALGFAGTLAAEPGKILDLSIAFGYPWQGQISISKTISSGAQPFGTMECTPSLDLSPVSLDMGLSLKWSAPLPVVTATLGGLVGSGWSIPGLANGVGVQNPASMVNDYSDKPFSNLYVKLFAGIALQFDTGAIWPGDWNHVFFQSYHQIYLQSLSGTGPTDLWEWQAGKGNRNGFKYYSVTLLGYQMPIILSRIVLMLETDGYITDFDASKMATGGWGSDFYELRPGLVATLTFSDMISLDAVAQFHTVPNYTTSPDTVLYQSKIDPNQQTRFEFYRAMLILNLKI